MIRQYEKVSIFDKIRNNVHVPTWQSLIRASKKVKWNMRPRKIRYILMKRSYSCEGHITRDRQQPFLHTACKKRGKRGSPASFRCRDAEVAETIYRVSQFMETGLYSDSEERRKSASGSGSGHGRGRNSGSRRTSIALSWPFNTTRISRERGRWVPPLINYARNAPGNLPPVEAEQPSTQGRRDSRFGSLGASMSKVVRKSISSVKEWPGSFSATAASALAGL